MLLPIILLIMLPLAGIAYYFSVQSRRTYRCPKCGEEVSTEYLEARRCGMCGAELVSK